MPPDLDNSKGEGHRVYHHPQGDSRRLTRESPTNIRSWTCQIILDAQGTYRHPAPAVRETSDSDLLSPVFLPAPPGVCESRAEAIVQPELSAATNATFGSAIWN